MLIEGNDLIAIMTAFVQFLFRLAEMLFRAPTPQPLVSIGAPIAEPPQDGVGAGNAHVLIPMPPQGGGRAPIIEPPQGGGAGNSQVPILIPPQDGAGAPIPDPPRAGNAQIPQILPGAPESSLLHGIVREL
ncbi:hypothetical protein A4A49_14311 [Nicotiana attenuata]|uniref:Uncharacterized protein n=1 Tax=Nicotiana attenuata TaxID=49451 RepID=A0A314KT52_NICAT|nr:hypothetical protein A4A49_14311 [Nicotiana attenuata]